MYFLKKRLLFLMLALLLLSGCALSPASPTPDPEGSFSVHYIDVGQADAALVACDGHFMLIDGGNAADSDLIYAYLQAQGASHLDCMVATHAHEDHVGGLSGALAYATVDTAYCPVTENDTRVFQNMVDALAEQGKSITVPQPGDTFALGSAQVEFLGPVEEYRDANNTSLVLRIDYGETSFLFTGDMEADAEQDLIDSGAELSATVLKVGHHGSDSSTSYVFLREVMPRYAVLSVGADNSYGHPSETVLSRLRDAEVTLWRTDLQGTVIADSDGSSVTFRTQRNPDVSTNPTQPVSGGYVGNSGSRKFHLPDCSALNNMNPDNQVFFASRAEAVAAGYQPCGRCDP